MEAFKEEQRFISYWWIICAPVLLLVTAVSVFAYMKGEGFTALAALPGIVFVLLILSLLKLTTRIDEKGIAYTFYPFIKEKFVAWDDIRQAEARNVNALLHYGGWGIRGWGKKRAYNVWGNNGLVVHTKDGREMMLGTNEFAKLTQYLQYLKTKYGIKAL